MTPSWDSKDGHFEGPGVWILDGTLLQIGGPGGPGAAPWGGGPGRGPPWFFEVSRLTRRGFRRHTDQVTLTPYIWECNTILGTTNPWVLGDVLGGIRGAQNIHSLDGTKNYSMELLVEVYLNRETPFLPLPG